jgi:poly-gamma-glutamate synthesis protein (capsule biosynthesis protein)
MHFIFAQYLKITYNYDMDKRRKSGVFFASAAGLGLALAISYYLFALVLASPRNATLTVPQAADTVREEAKPAVFLTQTVFLPPVENEPLRFLFFGDLMLDRHVKKRVEEKGLGHLLSDISSSTRAARYDIVMANLEGAVTAGGAHYPPAQAYDFAFAPKLIKELNNYGFNAFTIANNHLADQGERGIMETRRNLSDLGFFYVGCRDRLSGDCSTTTVEFKDKIIGLAGYSMVYGVLDEDLMLKQVSALAGSSDLTVVNMHWGIEYEHNFNPKQQQIGRSLIEAGADIVIGHHPHVVQGLEIYRGRPIFYSLGNFVFDQYFSPATQEGLAVGMEWKGEGLALELMPFKSIRSRPEMLAGDDQREFLERLVGWSNLGKNDANRVLFGGPINFKLQAPNFK